MRPQTKAMRTYSRYSFPGNEIGVLERAEDHGCQAGQMRSAVEVVEIEPRQQLDCGSHHFPLQYPTISSTRRKWGTKFLVKHSSLSDVHQKFHDSSEESCQCHGSHP